MKWRGNCPAMISKVMPDDQPQSPAGALPYLNAHAMSPHRAELSSTSPTSCCRGPRRPLTHSPGYKPPFLSVPSILQTADAGLAVEEMGVRGGTVRKVALISAFILL